MQMTSLDIFEKIKVIQNIYCEYIRNWNKKQINEKYLNIWKLNSTL